MALYQSLKSYVFQGEVSISVIDLKEFLFFDATKYARYSYFKRDVLRKSINKINEKTDLRVTFEETKVGRSIQHLTFTIVELREHAIETTHPDEKVRGKKSIQLDKVIIQFQEHGIELNALDGYKFIAKAKQTHLGRKNSLK